jgi:hypothetical protein
VYIVRIAPFICARGPLHRRRQLQSICHASRWGTPVLRAITDEESSRGLPEPREGCL